MNDRPIAPLGPLNATVNARSSETFELKYGTTATPTRTLPKIMVVAVTVNPRVHDHFFPSRNPIPNERNAIPRATRLELIISQITDAIGV